MSSNCGTGKFRRTRRLKLIQGVVLIPLLAIVVTFPRLGFAGGQGPSKTDVSGYAKSLNFFTETSGILPEQVDAPLVRAEEGEHVFNSLERLRFKVRSVYEISEAKSFSAKIDYDHQAYFGTFVSTGDFRVAEKQSEDRQFLDLSQTLAEEDNTFYVHRLYRATLAYETNLFQWEIGRQQIPWGVCYFFTPTDLFNPFNPTQIEPEERDGVDAVSVIGKNMKGYKIQAVYTPRGRQLHPQRYFARISRDVLGYEAGLLGGRVSRDYAAGVDLAGNLKGSALRGEVLYREADLEKDFFQFTVNADYNFPHNVHALLEYHFNGEGRRRPRDYQRDRWIRGEIRELSKNYLAFVLGHDVTPLLRIENRALLNLNDASLFIRPEIRYELRSNLLLTAGAQLFLGENVDEFGQPKNLYLTEVKYSF